MIFFKKQKKRREEQDRENVHLPLVYSWILTNQLAIGPMPRMSEHWSYLESLGFVSRFSCCYPDEQVYAQVPSNWTSVSYALPDHREQETLSTERLREALHAAERLIHESQGPVYLHCFAGMERSSLLAVGLTSILRDMDLFAALEWVRRCHPVARPIYQHLEILDNVLQEKRSNI